MSDADRLRRGPSRSSRASSARSVRWGGWVLALALQGAAPGALQAAPAAFEDSMAQRMLPCTVCHGAQGRVAPDGYYPRIAGKPAGYLYNQLLNFRDGRRHYGPMVGIPVETPPFSMKLRMSTSGTRSVYFGTCTVPDKYASRMGISQKPIFVTTP